MKHYRTTILLLLSVLLFSRCSKPSCIEDAGAMTSTERNVSPFHQIDLYDNIHLVLTQDTVEKITVEAQERLQPNISVTITDSVLSIRNITTCDWLRNPTEKIRVHVSVKQLERLNYHGSGNVTSTNTLRTNYIMFYSDRGAGNIHVKLDAKRADALIEYENADFVFEGKSDLSYVYINARGSIDFENFEVKQMVIGYAGVRDAVINVTDVLDVIIYHTGNLFYKGNPDMGKQQYYSSGKLYPLP